MSNSDAESIAQVPSDALIEKSLRRVVRNARESGTDVTVNNARAQAERELSLAVGFFKDSAKWKAKSKEIISDAFEAPVSPEKPTKSAPASKAGSKRKSEDAPAPKPLKKSRKSAEPNSGDDSDESGDVEVAIKSSKARPQQKPVKAAKPAKPAQRKLSEASPERSDDNDEGDQPTAPTNGGSASNAVDDESDYSSVLDEAPAKKKRAKKSASPGPAKSKAKPKPAKEKNSTTLTPDEEEIKRLQSWLLKCGVRKLWHRELAPYDSPKEKIRHLKSMLDEVGMTGRFSVEKARSIKEARELAAEIEAAKEFNEQWGEGAEEGRSGSDDGQTERKASTARRSKPKGLIDFGDSDESE